MELSSLSLDRNLEFSPYHIKTKVHGFSLMSLNLVSGVVVSEASIHLWWFFGPFSKDATSAACVWHGCE